MKKNNLHPNLFYEKLPKKHLSACILLPFQNNFLIVKKTITQKWSLPGGIIIENESPNQSAVRECIEEINITPLVQKLLHVYYSMPFKSFNQKRGDSIHFVFLGEELVQQQIDSIEFSDGEIDAFQLIEKDKISDYIGENLGKAIINGLNEVRYSSLQRTLSVFQQEEMKYANESLSSPI